MRALKVCGSLALSALLCGATTAQQRESMSWLALDFRPAFIPVEGELPGGIMGNTLKMIVQRWPEADHSVSFASPQGVYKALDSGEKVCFPASLLADDEKYYKTTVRVAFPQGLVINKDALKRLGLKDSGSVDLDLLKASNIQGVVAKGRGYQEGIQNLFPTLLSNGRLIEAPMASPTNLLQMVQLGRVDYTFEYQTAMVLHISQKKIDLSNVVWLPIRQLPLVPIYILCPKTPWGKEKITRIDRIVTDLAKLEEFRNLLRPWERESSWKLYAKQHKDFYDSRMQPSPATTRQP